MKPAPESSVFINRELSWLAFNSRVLEEVVNRRNPLLERLKFYSIFISNLDEYFMKRVGGLKRRNEAVYEVLKKTDPEIDKTLNLIRQAVLPMLAKQADYLNQTLLPELASGGIRILSVKELNESQSAWATDFFKRNFFSVLTPLVVDEGHPFPFISNLSTSLGVLLADPQDESETVFARIKVPNVFPSWIQLPNMGDTTRLNFVSSHQLIESNLELLFPGMKILSSCSFRVLRNAIVDRELDEEEESDDLLEIVAEELKERRFAEAIRLEISPGTDPKIADLLKAELNLTECEVYALPMGLEFYQLGPICDIKKTSWEFPVWTPMSKFDMENSDRNIFDVIREKDVLVHHPFESFSQSVERLIKEASEDPKVVAIKMTIYRTGEDSPFIPYLIRAAAAGKQVACLVELQARFDEERNILAAQALEKAGVHVVYGIKGLKTHSKIALVVRQEGNSMRSYVHLGTGNYNVKTARLYTDLGFFTSKPEITEDVVQLFHHLTGKSLHWNFRKLLVAPIDMRTSFLRMIEREINHVRDGRVGHIIFKVNNLEDPEIIEALYRASQAGVKVDLMVRTICCLKPQVKGLSENIRVVSILGRFLEHSRVFYFRNGAESLNQGEYFIGSSDLMTRNLNSRVEAVAPIADSELKKQLAAILECYWTDPVQAWDMDFNGNFKKRQSSESELLLSSQEKLMLQALKVQSQSPVPFVEPYINA